MLRISFNSHSLCKIKVSSYWGFFVCLFSFYEQHQDLHSVEAEMKKEAQRRQKERPDIIEKTAKKREFVNVEFWKNKTKTYSPSAFANS